MFVLLGHLHRLCATDPKISSDAKKNNIVDTNKQSLEHAVLSDNRMAAHIAAASQSFEQGTVRCSVYCMPFSDLLVVFVKKMFM